MSAYALRVMTTDTLHQDSHDRDENTFRLGPRLYRALGPVLGGLVLDFADLVTFGPFGIYGGIFVGAAIGWWMTSFSRLAPVARVAVAGLAGVYCALPFTHFLPLATAITAAMRFCEDPDEARDESEPASH